MTERRCDTCEFAKPKQGKFMWCLRYPPTVFIDPDYVDECIMWQPLVRIDDWCGEWKAKELTAPTDPLS